MVATWDLAARDFFDEQQSQASASQAPAPAPRRNTCERLYKDFLNRRNKRREYEDELEAERRRQEAEETRPKYVDTNPTVNAKSQQRKLEQLASENAKLRDYLTQLRLVEKERQYLVKAQTLVPRVPAVSIDPSDPLFEELRFIGCPVTNAPCINSLFANHKRATIERVLRTCQEAQEAQRHMYQGDEEILLSEQRKIESELVPAIKAVADEAALAILIREGLNETELLHTRMTKQGPMCEWCFQPTIADLMKSSIVEYLTKHSGKFEELTSIRRRILFEAVVMMIQNLLSVTKLDVKLLSMFNELRLPRMKIRGYREDLPELIRDNEWFVQHVGSTSSLKNNHIINQSVRDLIRTVCYDMYTLKDSIDAAQPTQSRRRSQ